MLIVVTTAICAIAAAGYTARSVEQYASKATVFISTAPSDTQDAYQGGLFSEQRVQSYVGIVNGLKLAQQVIDHLHLDTTAAELSKKISASTVANTVLLDVTVTDPSPAQAQLINDAVVAQLSKTVAELETPPSKKVPLLKATVVDPPRLPTTPVSPKPVRNLALGLILGLLLGFGLAVLRELLDNTVKHPGDLPELHDMPVLSALAYDNDVQKHPLINTLPSHAPRAEAYRVLRTNLQFLDVDSQSKAFVVTSSVPGEGKSTIASNVALALASGGRNVLLVDGDLRRPRVASMLSLEGAVGLTTLLVGNVKLDDALQEHSSGLHVLTSGVIPPNPAELLQSQAMRDLMAALRERFDIIIIDATPLLPVTDAALIASVADGALVVVRHGKTTKDQLLGAFDRLDQVDAAALGLILSMVPRKRGLGGAYGYGYGYGYGYAPIREPGKRHSKKGRREDARNAEPDALDEAVPDAALESAPATEVSAEPEADAEATYGWRSEDEPSGPEPDGPLWSPSPRPRADEPRESIDRKLPRRGRRFRGPGGF